MSTSFPLKDLVKSARPKQWVKNLFVLAPLIFAKLAMDLEPMAISALVFALFCMASSSVYLFNDVMDREQDRNHPEKRHRPIAAGTLSPATALAVSSVLVVASSLGALAIDWRLSLTVSFFFLLNLLYTTLIKRVPYLDVLFIGFGFMLRVMGGAYAINVQISNWILLCTLFIALYLGLGKRIHELCVVKPEGGVSRKVLQLYNLKSATLLLYVTGLAALISFVFYTQSARAMDNFGTAALGWTAPLVALGQLRFSQLVRSRRHRSPTDAMVTDPVFVGVAILWVGAVVVLVYINQF